MGWVSHACHPRTQGLVQEDPEPEAIWDYIENVSLNKSNNKILSKFKKKKKKLLNKNQ